jgi:hypothetical protein
LKTNDKFQVVCGSLQKNSRFVEWLHMNPTLKPNGQNSDIPMPDTAKTAVNGGAALDPNFDPARLRLSQDFSNLGVKKALLTVPVRKPDRQSFIRVHPESKMQVATAVLELKEDRETYLIHPTLWDELATEITPKLLCTAITRHGVVFLWPIRLPGADGKHDPWSRSALEAAQIAMKRWIRLTANMSLGAYEVFEAPPNVPEPEWPELDLQDLLKIAFRDRYIADLEHPVINRLRGRL